jgi:hypothetical protein
MNSVDREEVPGRASDWRALTAHATARIRSCLRSSGGMRVPSHQGASSHHGAGPTPKAPELAGSGRTPTRSSGCARQSVPSRRWIMWAGVDAARRAHWPGTAGGLVLEVVTVITFLVTAGLGVPHIWVAAAVGDVEDLGRPSPLNRYVMLGHLHWVWSYWLPSSRRWRGSAVGQYRWPTRRGLGLVSRQPELVSGRPVPAQRSAADPQRGKGRDSNIPRQCRPSKHTRATPRL